MDTTQIPTDTKPDTVQIPWIPSGLRPRRCGVKSTPEAEGCATFEGAQLILCSRAFIREVYAYISFGSRRRRTIWADMIENLFFQNSLGMSTRAGCVSMSQKQMRSPSDFQDAHRASESHSDGDKLILCSRAFVKEV